METAEDQADFGLRYFQEREVCLTRSVERTFGPEVKAFLSRHADLAHPGTEVLATAESFNIEALNGKSLHTLINLKRINDLGNPNDFFDHVNAKLPPGGTFITCVETQRSRRRRLLNKYPRPLAYPYYALDFILKRIFPKLGATRKIYSLLTRGQNRVMSMTEAMGRLAACGFEVLEYQDIGYNTHFVCRKVQVPRHNGSEVAGLLIRLPRVGQGGRPLNVYKLRTMHPFAEYLQDYVHQRNSVQAGGKFKGDFRVTGWGRLLRKLWIDEQPMWINFFKGEMKLVGVRPLSAHYFSLYPPELQALRVRDKPGLIPPFYADLPATLEEICASERRYLEAYARCPWTTDLRYFCKAFYNIFIRRARSS